MRLSVKEIDGWMDRLTTAYFDGGMEAVAKVEAPMEVEAAWLSVIQ